MELTIDGKPAKEYKTITPEASERIEKIKSLPDGELCTKDRMAELLNIPPSALSGFSKKYAHLLDDNRILYKKELLFGNTETIAEAKRQLK
jgi:hypothetical protein